jgi:hypothetical protein
LEGDGAGLVCVLSNAGDPVTVRTVRGSPARTEEVKECRHAYRWTELTVMSRITGVAVVAITAKAPDQARKRRGTARF